MCDFDMDSMIRGELREIRIGAQGLWGDNR